METSLCKSNLGILILFMSSSSITVQGSTELLNAVRAGIASGVMNIENSGTGRDLLKFVDKAARRFPETTRFPCDFTKVKPRSDNIPNNVNRVRPGDIDVIGAIGDSLTAGTGISAITPIAEVFISQRGRSWSGGGEKSWRTFLTVPNILKEFNPNLIGFALDASSAQLNMGFNGATSSSIPAQAVEMVKRIKRDSRIDFKNHWKMVTLMIGDNDFCSEICLLRSPYDSLELHRKDLIGTLRYLKKNLPRTIVNIVPPPKLDLLFTMKDFIICTAIQNIVCSCLKERQYIRKRPMFSDVMEKWQMTELEVSLMQEWRSNDFAVLLQPFTFNYTVPKTFKGRIDYSYLAPDCFHLSEIGQAKFANDYWNSLMEPYSRKTFTGSKLYSKFLCPTEEFPYISTPENS